MVVAILNGALREGALNPNAGEATGHVASTVLLCILILAISFVSVEWLDPRSPGQAATVSVLWLFLTLAFEFVFGHFVAGKSWVALLADYNLTQGRVWLLVPITVAAAPYVAARLRGRL
jgi:hypothetical protein